MMIKAVIFDLDQTLIDRKATFTNFLEGQYSRFFSRLEGTSQEQFITTVFEHDNNGYTAKDEVYGLLCDKLKLSGVSEDELLADFKERYGHAPVLFDGVHEVLVHLKKTYQLGLITNGRTIGQSAKIDKSEIRHYFDSIKISEKEGVKKPNGRIFENCIQELSLEANECVFVGDHPVNDVEAAKSVGMLGVWIKNDNYSAPETHDGIIGHVSELSKLLNEKIVEGSKDIK